MKKSYTYEEYLEDVEKLRLYAEKVNAQHIVALYRGGLPLGTHLSNILTLPLSIIKYQTYDSSDDVPQIIHNQIIDGETVLVVDDLLDTGNSMSKTIELLNKECPNSLVRSCTLVAKHQGIVINPDSFYARLESDWIEFWWEV